MLLKRGNFQNNYLFMKKLLGIVVLGLLLSGNAYANTINEPFDLWCKSYKKEFYDGDEKILKSVSENYHLNLLKLRIL